MQRPKTHAPLVSPNIDALDLLRRAEATFGHLFEVRRLVAASSERALFVARDSVLRREAALRVHLQPETRSRIWFQRETELLASLDHPSLRTVFSAGQAGGWAYRVTKWIEGESLDAAVRRGPRPIPWVLRIARALSSLLEYVHSNQITFRRLTPATVMIDTTGRVMVIDLRFASVLLDVADRWEPESIPFVAPEIRAGGAGDAESDIYSLGAILYFALTGQAPPADPRDIRPPRELRSSSPQTLDRIILRSLAQSPSGRYATAAEMHEDLISDLGEGGLVLPVSLQLGSAYEDASAWEKHLRRALGEDYELLDELGSGGFGRVYRVRDLELEREVALKVLHPFLTSDPNVVERFRREAQLAARLTHNHIVNTFDIGGRSGVIWYTMEYVSGGSLAQQVERHGPMGLHEVTRFLFETLAALQHAHNYGLAHRDLKPENILFTHPDRSTRIADFGLALAFERPDRFGGATSRSGTPEFAAPEQLLGERVDNRVDLYSLTLCAFYALTGHAPFGGGSPTAILARHTMGALPDLTSRADVGDDMLRVLAKGAAREPDDRYETAEAFAHALAESLRPRWRKPLHRWRRALFARLGWRRPVR